MSYAITGPTVYIVEWPDVAIVKVGYSSRQRWRKFVNRGAVVVDLVPTETRLDGYALESLVSGWFRSEFPRAFVTAVESVPYVGYRGDGWRECYRLPAGLQPMDFLRWRAGNPTSMSISTSASIASSIAASTARTYERTYEQLLTFGSYLTLSNARRGVARFSAANKANR